jgi:hypothetical protein
MITSLPLDMTEDVFRNWTHRLEQVTALNGDYVWQRFTALVCDRRKMATRNTYEAPDIFDLANRSSNQVSQNGIN